LPTLSTHSSSAAKTASEPAALSSNASSPCSPKSIGLLPQDIFTRLLDECRRGASSYDLIGGLFRQMNDPNPVRAGRYTGVDYFNGGLFATVDPIELTLPELGPLFAAANENNWGYVQPVIFGTLFESSLGKEERHACRVVFKRRQIGGL
jgi:hypothetical protein